MTLDQCLNVVNITVSILIAIITYLISKKLSAKNKYDHEINVCEQLSKFLGQDTILADVKKYNSFNRDINNTTYYKQGCGLHHIIQNYGIVVSINYLHKPKLGLVPFEWIEYIRKNDSEDNKCIIVCKFKGLKLYKNFKSPIREVLNSGI